MKKSKTALVLLAGALLIWTSVLWPIPRFFGKAVPYTERRAGNVPAVSELVPGDHVQLLYHFWLCRDMISGKTPAFSNIYEFNTGDDEARRHFDPFYVPFSLVYAAVSPLFGNAAGWNAAGLFSVLLGVFGLFALARRFTSSDAVALGTALVLSSFPYRWITLICGSPTGFACGIVPWLLYGLDKAVRDKSPAGGAIAGFALLASYCSDLHVFYFSALLTPCWCVFSWLAQGAPFHPDRRRVFAVLRALVPAVLLAGLAVALSSAASSGLEKSTMAGGRTLKELKLFSPIMSALFRWNHLGISNHIFFGNGLAALLLAGYAGFLVRLRKDRNHLLSVILLSIAVVAVILLAFGTYGPLDALPIRIARKFIPKYTMIRQPMKIFCILPPLLAALTALLFDKLPAAKRPVKILAIILAVAAVAEHALWFRPAFSELPETLTAYRDAAKSIRSAGEEPPHAVCVPLWPGDSHWSSIYEYGVIGNRIRLVNGYSPSVPEDYYENVFSKLDSLNGGMITDDQIALLRSIGVNLLIFHEQPYPSKVSPFPSGIALRRLRANSALREIAAADGAFAFAFTGKPSSDTTDMDGLPSSFPAAGHWLAGKLADPKGEPGLATLYRIKTRSPVPAAPGMRYLLLLSGGGKLTGDAGTEVSVPQDETWISVPFTLPMGEYFKVTEGRPFMRHALITAGPETELPPGASLTWRAADLFHLGYTDEATGAVSINPKRNFSGPVIFGPDLPFPAGTYELSVDADCAPGDALGAEAFGHGGANLGTCPPAETLAFTHDGLLPLRLTYHFGGSAFATVRSLTLRRVK